jgi:hypothetical protein
MYLRAECKESLARSATAVASSWESKAGFQAADISKLRLGGLAYDDRLLLTTRLPRPF